jgi:hypothetical protein
MVRYDPLKDRSEQCGWPRVCDETPPTQAEQDTWAAYTLWFVVVFCVVTMFWFMDNKPW